MVEKNDKPYWRDSLIVFARMSGWICGPIVIALFLGKWLDTHFGTAPFIFVGSTTVAFLASSLGIVREAKRYMKKIEFTKNTNGTDTTNNTDNH